MSLEEQIECPLCMEPLEMDDINFFPCTCGYQICRFCWHRIRTDENGLCPACRKAYQEDPAEFKPLTEDELQRIKKERRQKDLQRKQKAAENRKHLANVRVVQRNLVFVVGLSQRLADPEVLKKHEYFGKFGKIIKVVINQSTSYAGAQVGGPSASAYITYQKSEDALRAIQAVNNIHVDGRTLKASLGTTKYCSHFLRGTQCPKPDCMYLHELGEEAASFTKEEMQQGKHQEYEQRLYEQFMNSQNIANTGAPPPAPSVTPPVQQQPVSNNNVQKQNKHSRKKPGSPPCSNHHQQNSPPVSIGDTAAPPPHLSQNVVASTQHEAWPSLQIGSKNSTTSNTAASAIGSTTDQLSMQQQQRLHHTNGSKPNSNSDPQQQPQRSDSTTPRSTSSSPDTYNSSSSSGGGGSSNSQPIGLPPHLSRAPGHHRNSDTAHSPRTPEISPSVSQQPAPPPGLLPPGAAMMLPPHLQKRHPPFDNPADSLSLFSMSGFTGMRGLTKPHTQTEEPLVPAVPEIPDTLPVSSTTDWQAAFGFTPAASTACTSSSMNPISIDNGLDSQDDDLGFDPWMESSKALADLVEKEGSLQHKQQHQLQNHNHLLGSSSSSQSTQIKNLPPGFTPNHIGAFPQGPYLSLGTAGSSVTHSNGGVPHLAPPPHLTQHMPQQPLGAGSQTAGSGVMPPPHHSKQDTSNHIQNNMQDWQEGLRALFPNINISFGQNSTNSHNSQSQQQPKLQQQNNAYNRTNSWDLSYDPAIVTSGQVERGDGSEPHWMASLHSLTEDSSAHRLPFVQQFHGPSSAAASSAQQGGAASSRGSSHHSAWGSASAAAPPPGFHHHHTEHKQLATEGL